MLNFLALTKQQADQTGVKPGDFSLTAVRSLKRIKDYCVYSADDGGIKQFKMLHLFLRDQHMLFQIYNQRHVYKVFMAITGFESSPPKS